MKTARNWLVFTGLSLAVLLLVGGGSGSTAARAQGASVHYFPFVSRAPLPPAASPPTQYGVNFINSVDHPADTQMFAAGRSTGATWNRWPLYWSRIEKSPGSFDWADHDRIVQGDIAYGFRTNAILLGTPSFYTTADVRPADLLTPDPIGSLALRSIQRAAPVGLYDPVFTDGSDAPAPGKKINPNNRWARFVFEIVSRYRPGGILAGQRGWAQGQGITHWEMWNEPDFNLFWDSSQADYARLLKVGYLAAKQADPRAVVIFGGLANNGDLNFFENILNIYQGDSLAAANNYYHDIFATHAYSRSYRTWYHVFRAERRLKAFNLNKDIWVNEAGVPLWDDYPGPVWDSGSWFRAASSEKSDYIVQSAFYAFYAGADAYFHFQLYDGCGNQPAYTNFPPHNGELCDANGRLVTDPSKPCAGDAHGLFRNPSNAICFSQHPQAGSARAALTAFQLLTGYAQGVQPLTRSRPNGTIEIIQLLPPLTNTRLVGMWALTDRPETAVIPARSGSALLVRTDGFTQTVTPTNGEYRISLPGATNKNGPYSPGSPYFDPSLYMIGGKTYILIEDNG